MSSSAVRPFTSFGLHLSSPDRIDIVQLWEEWSNEIQRSSRSGLRRHADGGCNRGNRASNTIADSNEARTTGTARYNISTSDKNFVNDILSDGMAEVDTTKLAKDHAVNMARSSTRST